MWKTKQLILSFAFTALTLRSQNVSQGLGSNPSEASTKINSKDGLTYVRIPPGTSLLGCTLPQGECLGWEEPVHRVTMKNAFWIGQTEVTQEAYARVAGANPSRYIGQQLPVDQISWHEAQKYCAAAGMRLPTGEEWEYAARGRGSPGQELGAVAWYNENSADSTHPVGQKGANSYGLYDMLGNVWEWVQDDYQNSSAKSFKRLRGGSFFNPLRELHVSNFLWATPDTAHRDMGFRCSGD